MGRSGIDSYRPWNPYLAPYAAIKIEELSSPVPQRSRVYSKKEAPKSVSQEEVHVRQTLSKRYSDSGSADDFEALEAKVYRTIEMYKAAREAKNVAERDAKRLREQLDERDQEVQTLRREMVQLRKDREEIRGRVEKMLHQMEAVAEQAAS